VCGRKVHFEERRVRILVKLVCAQDVGFAQRIDSGIRREHRKKRPDKRPTINPIEQQIAFEPSDISRCLSLVISPKIRVPVARGGSFGPSCGEQRRERGAAIFTKRALRQREYFFRSREKIRFGNNRAAPGRRPAPSFCRFLRNEMRAEKEKR